MKKRICSLLLALCLVLSLSGTALAAGIPVENDDKSISITGMNGTMVSFERNSQTGEQDQVKVILTSPELSDGEQYLILMVSGKTDTDNPTVPEITAGTIRYIDQKQATAVDGTITFTVYPDKLQSSVILISSAAKGQLVVAIVDAKYVLGDANGDGKVNLYDVITMLQYLAGISPGKEQMDVQAGDIDPTTGDPGFNLYDAIALLQCLAELRQIAGLVITK